MICGSYATQYAGMSGYQTRSETDYSLPTSSTFKIFIGNLDERTPVTTLKPLFERFGKVVECDVVKNYGFVHMENETEARRAIQSLNGYLLNGQRIKCEPSKPKSVVNPLTSKIFVGNLTSNVKAAQIRELFEKYGHVVECDRIRNYGFVHMDAGTDIPLIIKELNGFVLDGQPLNIQLSSSRVRPRQGKPEKCYKCGRSGHWSKDCTKSTGERYRDHTYSMDPYPQVQANLTYSNQQHHQQHQQPQQRFASERYGYFNAVPYEDYYDNYNTTNYHVHQVNYGVQSTSTDQQTLNPAQHESSSYVQGVQNVSEAMQLSNSYDYGSVAQQAVQDYSRMYEDYMYGNAQYDRRW